MVHGCVGIGLSGGQRSCLSFDPYNEFPFLSPDFGSGVSIPGREIEPSLSGPSPLLPPNEELTLGGSRRRVSTSTSTTDTFRRPAVTTSGAPTTTRRPRGPGRHTAFGP